MKRILIDTNIYIEAMRGNEEIVEKLRIVNTIGISAISVGELLAGVKLQDKPEKYADQLKEFLDSPRVEFFPVTYTTTDFYSEIYVKLRKAGTPIPTNDMWIAATALEHGLFIYTLDKHFDRISGLNFY
ncbi:MAG: type II toxin-antitoxin system VapC family toxin [bacterium]